jgi:hypothetical protein
MFSGRQPRQDVKVSDVSGTDCVSTFRVVEPKPMVWLWFYQAISNPEDGDAVSPWNVEEPSHLMRLSAREYFTELRLFVLCNKNQPGALFIRSLFRQSTSTCFGIFVAQHREVCCVYTTIGMCCAVQLTICWPAGRPTDSQLKSVTRTNCCMYRAYLLMMGYKYARNR